MSLEQKDLELIERIVYKSMDDIAVSIMRSFERLEERIDMGESRIYARMADVEDKHDVLKQDIHDAFDELKEQVQDLMRLRELTEV